MPQMYVEVAVLLVTSLLFGRLYDLLHILYNPFGDRPIDLPHLAVGGGIRKMARAFASGNYLPPTMELRQRAEVTSEERGRYQRDGNECPGGGIVDDDLFLMADPEEEEELDDEYILNATRDNLYADGRGSLFAGLTKCQLRRQAAEQHRRNNSKPMMTNTMTMTTSSAPVIAEHRVYI